MSLKNSTTFLEAVLFFPFGLFTPETTKFFQYLQLGLIFIIVLAFFVIRTYPVGNSGSGYADLTAKPANAHPS
jgi:hypothetical protein